MTLEEFVAGLDYVSFEDVRAIIPAGLLDAKGRLLVGPKVSPAFPFLQKQAYFFALTTS